MVAPPSLAKMQINRSPGSTVAGSATAWAVISVADDDGVIDRTVGNVLGAGAAVVKVQVASAASGLPAASFTPASPLLIVATYIVDGVRSAVALRVAVKVAASYVTVAGSTSVVP